MSDETSADQKPSPEKIDPRLEGIERENNELRSDLDRASRLVVELREENRKLAEQVSAQRQLIQAMELLEERRKSIRFHEVGTRVSVKGKVYAEIDAVQIGRDGIRYLLSWWTPDGPREAVARADEVELLDPETLPLRQGSIAKENK